MRQGMLIFVWLICSLQLHAQTNRFQYWFDDDFASAQEQSISTGSNLDVSRIIDVSSMTSGVHVLNFRFQNESGYWSVPASAFFICRDTIQPANALLTEAEIWFDQDYPNVQTISLPPGESIQLSEMVDVSTLEPGLHSMHMRFLDDHGAHASVVSRYVYLTNDFVMQPAQLQAVEYWFDDQISAAQQSMLAGADVHWMQAVDVSGLQAGLHSLNYRFVDDQGQYSVADSRFFLYSPLSVNQEHNPLISFRYWLNDSIQNAVVIPLDTVQDLILSETIPLQTYSAGDYLISYQFQDSLGNWSVPLTDSIEKDVFPWLSFLPDQNEFCGSGVLSVSLDTVDVTEIVWNYGDGNSENTLTPNHTYTDPGAYLVTAEAIHSSGASELYQSPDSLFVYAEYLHEISESICDGDSLLFEGSYYQEAGSFDVMYQSVHFCDSVWRLNLNLNPVYDVLLSESICAGDSVQFDGNWLTEEGDYSLNETSISGCDSLVNFSLTVFQPDSVFVSDEMCSGDSVFFEGNWYQTGGNYSVSFTNQNNCDSVMVLDLTEHPVPGQPLISQVGDTLYTSDADSHLWYLDGGLLTETTDSMLVCTESGDYFVIASSAYNCLSDTSEVISVVITWADKHTSSMQVYPNPVTDRLFVEMDHPPEPLPYRLSDNAGRLIYGGIIRENSSWIDMSALESGVYYLQVETPESRVSIRLVKN